MYTDIVIAFAAVVQAVFTILLVTVYVRRQTNIIKAQKTIDVRQTLLTELAINFTIMVENVREMENLSKEPHKPGRMETIAKILQNTERLSARNSAITNELNQLPPIT
jgi:hypothetical protein